MKFRYIPSVTTKTMLQILSILDEEGKAHWKKIAQKTDLSESTIKKNLEILRDLNLIAATSDISDESGRPIKPYYLTDYGKLVVKKLEELEAILEAAKAGEGWIKVGEVEID